MYTKTRDRIMDNSIDKILNIFPNTKTQYKLRYIDGKWCKVSKSKHLTKSGRQYAKFVKIKRYIAKI